MTCGRAPLVSGSTHRATLASGGGFAPSRVPAVKTHFAWAPSTSPRSPSAAIRLGRPNAYLSPSAENKGIAFSLFSFSQITCKIHKQFK